MAKVMLPISNPRAERRSSLVLSMKKPANTPPIASRYQGIKNCSPKATAKVKSERKKMGKNDFMCVGTKLNPVRMPKGKVEFKLEVPR